MSVDKLHFEEPLGGLEAGLRVEHIAVSRLETCLISDDAATVLTRFRDFTCIPVRENQDGPIIGVLEQSDPLSQGTVEQHMCRLNGSMLISAEAPLAELIPLLGQSLYRLVVTKKGIEGIVTPSDFQKLPARLYTFALITRLELVMMEIIQQKTAKDDKAWLKHLKKPRLEKLEEKHQKLQNEDSDLPLLELTEFCDKRDILMKLLASHQGFSRNAFEEDLKAIEKLRNSVAHAGSYADDAQRGQKFIVRLTKTAGWIKALSSYLEEPPPAEEPIRIPQPASIAIKE